jgi:hypothetical protein
LGRVPPTINLDLEWLSRIGLGSLKPFDELVGFIAGEPTPGLTLSKPHRTAGVSKISMSGVLNEGK